jgi:hypothetical protein
VDYALLEKAMKWYAKGSLFKERKIYLHGRYPAVAIYNEKIHVHRLICMYISGGKLPANLHVHHKDGNRLNSSVQNLEITPASLHISSHQKGRKASAETKLKISEAGRKRKGLVLKRKYTISLEDIRAILSKKSTISFVAKKYGCDRSVIKQRLTELLNAA